MNCPRCTYFETASLICSMCFASIDKKPIYEDTSEVLTLSSSIISSQRLQPLNSTNIEKCQRCQVIIHDLTSINCSCCGDILEKRPIKSKQSIKSSITCYKCGEVGHYANACRQRKNQSLDIVGGSKYLVSDSAIDGIIELIHESMTEEANLYQLCSPLPHG